MWGRGPTPIIRCHPRQSGPGRQMKIAVGHVGPRQWAMTLIVTTIGAVSTTLLGVLAGSILSSRSQKRQWSRDRQADACAQVLRESSNVLIEFNRLTRQPVEPAADGATVPTPMDWKPWNEALAMIVLVADHEIVEAAQAIDAQIWPVHQQIKRGWIPAGGWLKLRDAIEARRERFVNVARKRLAPPGPPLRRLTGRPAPDDPFWEFRRSYFSPDNPGEGPASAEVASLGQAGVVQASSKSQGGPR
jgi:hypothetical protein